MATTVAVAVEVVLTVSKTVNAVDSTPVVVCN